MVSGSISLPYSGYFSPFPHGTCSLSVTQEYLALPDGAGRFKQSFTGSALLRIQVSYYVIHLQDYHLLWCSFPTVFCSDFVRLYLSYYPNMAVTTLVWANPLSLATTQGITVVFSSSWYLDVSVPTVCLTIARHILTDGLPHSEIYGSMTVCVYP